MWMYYSSIIFIYVVNNFTNVVCKFQWKKFKYMICTVYQIFY